MRCMVVNRVLNHIKKEKLVSKYFIFILVLFITALNYNIFLLPFKIVAGGSSGLALIINNLFDIKPSTFILIFQLIVLIVSYFVVGFRKSSSALVASILYPLFVEITSPWVNSFVISAEHIIIVSILSGVINGITTGYLCKIGMSQGGIILVSQMIHEKTKLSVSKINTFINVIIILAGGFYFGITTLLCAIIITYVSEVLIDRVLLGTSSNKIYYIITEKSDEIVDYVLNELNNSVTVIDDHNTKDNKKTIMLVVSNSLYLKVSENIKRIDPQVTYSTVDAYQLSIKK